MARGLFQCDEHGMALAELHPGIQAPEFSFTAYLRWSGFRDFEAELPTAEVATIGRTVYLLGGISSRPLASVNAVRPR